ncbi:MAG: methyltransferase domain-containing protein [Actinomycetota bacterium]
MDERLETLLVCSVCQSSLTSERSGLRCPGCDRVFAITDGVPDLTPVPPPDPGVLERWPLWEELQRNGEHMYVADPPSSLSVGAREDVALFAEFADLQGLVLDIGCGPQSEPSYAVGFGGTFVGIDPLRGAGPARHFPFVQGIGEFLPFRSATFDRVLFGASLDHTLSPELALREARRVVSMEGAVVIWLGELPDPPGLAEHLRTAATMLRAGDLRGLAGGLLNQVRSRRGTPASEATFSTPDGQVLLEVPSGAVDAFHVEHPRAETVAEWLAATGLLVRELERPLAGSCFIRATPA